MVTSFKSIRSFKITDYYNNLKKDINDFVIYTLYKVGCKPDFDRYLYERLLNNAYIESYCKDFNVEDKCDTGAKNKEIQFLRYKKCVINKYKLKSEVCIKE